MFWDLLLPTHDISLPEMSWGFSHIVLQMPPRASLQANSPGAHDDTIWRAASLQPRPAPPTTMPEYVEKRLPNEMLE